jgi:predicted Rossmann fold flavoprotein
MTLVAGAGDESSIRAIVVVGAGAAGLWAAQRAGELMKARGKRPDVLLLEKTPRAETKVLASGGTRCNLTTTLGPQPAAQLFGSEGGRFLKTAFRMLPPSAVREQFLSWGVPSVAASLEKVFPKSGSAKDVRDALVRACDAAGVEMRRDCSVTGLERAGDRWRVHVADGRSIDAIRLLLSPGGKSYPGSGTTGDGYSWLAELGLELVPGVPALVPLVSPKGWVHELTGLSVQDAVVRLRDGAGKMLGKRDRPVLFTHRGLSGPGAMDLSHFVARASAAQGSGGSATVDFTMEIDLLPRATREALAEQLRLAASRTGAPTVARLFAGELPRRLVETACEQAGLDTHIRCNVLPRAKRHALVEKLKALPVPISGTAGFDEAEVTAGGLALRELDPGTMRVRRFENLYVFGEVIDLHGPIGGLNFQAAFATAELAALAAVGG